MASIADAHNALIARLQSMPGRPEIAYPNGPLVKDLPRIVVQVLSPVQRTLNLEGTTDAIAEINARIEVEGGKFDAQASTILTAIQGRFAPGTTFDGVSITQAPRPGKSYLDRGVYHTPVTIRGRFFF